MKRKVWNLVVVIGLLVSACGIYFLAGDNISESWAVMVTENDGGGTGTKSCGSYYSYPPRCSEGYETTKVTYGSRTCYSSCKKAYTVVRTTCSSGDPYTSMTAATAYCNQQGFSKTEKIETLSNGMVCAACTDFVGTCESEYGLFSSQKDAIAECGGTSEVASFSKYVNAERTYCYGCKGAESTDEAESHTAKCTPITTGACYSQNSCVMVGGIWNSAWHICKAQYDSYSEYCASEGAYYYRQVCPEGYESYLFVNGTYLTSAYCYTGCVEDYLEKERAEACEDNNLLYKEPTCADGTKAEEKKIEFKHGVATCYYACGKTSGETGYTIIYKNGDEYEDYGNYVVTFDKAGWSIYYAVTPLYVPIPASADWQAAGSDKSVTVDVDSAGQYYIYAKDPNGDVKLLDSVIINNPANNKAGGLNVVLGNGEVNSLYQGSAMNALALGETNTVDGYTIQDTNSLTYPNNMNKVVALSSKINNKMTIKNLGSTEDKILTVDSDTGLLLYTLNDTEKTALGITDEKVYVLSAKEAAKVTRNSDGTFTKDAGGNITAASTGEKGTIYKVTPKNDVTFMREYTFYAIVLDYIDNASYSDPNIWNDINLLSYNNATAIDTDFTFEVARNGWSGIVTKLSSTNGDVKVMPLASATNDNLGTIYIDFESDVTQYEFSVNSDQVTLNPVLVYTDSEYVEGFGPRTVDLEYGVNIEYIKVESAKGTERTYTLLITRIDSRSSDNTLKSLVARNVELTPSFTKYTNTYYGTVANSVTKVEIAAEKNNSNASFVSGYGSRTVNLKVGENTILVKVTSETGSERVYTLVITRAGTPEVVNVDKTKSANNNLESLVVSSGSMMFDSNVINYNLYVSNSITSVLVTAVADDEKATLVTTGGTNLQVGTNKVEVVVTAENGTTKTYTINVIRKEEGLIVSTDSTLSDLQISGKNVNFSPTNYLYSVTVFPGVEELNLSLTPSNTKAQIEVIGNQELTDYTTVKVKVTAEDGSYSIYDINVSVNNITKTEIAIFIGCCILVVGLVVYGTISRNRKKKELNI